MISEFGTLKIDKNYLEFKSLILNAIVFVSVKMENLLYQVGMMEK